MLRREKIKADFCVIGGGISGICAAVSAARNGANVVLMHERSVLGGNASSEIRMWVCGANGENNRETGIIEEINLENLYRNPTKNYHIWDTVLYGIVVREPNIKLLLNCTCMDAQTEEGSFPDGRTRKINCVTGYQMTTQTFYDIEAKFYADCSGDSILAPLTGAEYKTGREAAEEYGEDTHVKKADNMTMGMSCLLQGRETERPIKYTLPDWAGKVDGKYFEARNLDPFKSSENYWYLELGGNRDSIHDTDEIQKELIPLALNAWDYVKNSGKFESDNWDLDFLGFIPGKRESRRMVGEYIMTERDISGNADFEDVIAYGGWPLDDHFPAGFYHQGEPNTYYNTPAPYKIPYRALYSKNVLNLFFAGRNISVTHTALSSTRVMATCGLLGEAVGAAAAIAARENLTPHGVYLNKIETLQQILMNQDCFLPGLKRRVSEDCEKSGICESLRSGEDRAHAIYGMKKCGAEIENGQGVAYEFASPVQIGDVHIVFDSDLNRETLEGDFCERTHSMRANIRLDSPIMSLPKTLCRAFRLEAEYCGQWETVLEVNENFKRCYHIPFNKKAEKLRLVPLSNWGGTEKTNVLSFDFI